MTGTVQHDATKPGLPSEAAQAPEPIERVAFQAAYMAACAALSAATQGQTFDAFESAAWDAWQQSRARTVCLQSHPPVALAAQSERAAAALALVEAIENDTSSSVVVRLKNPDLVLYRVLERWVVRDSSESPSRMVHRGTDLDAAIRALRGEAA